MIDTNEFKFPSQVAEIQLFYKRNIHPSQRTQVNSSDKVYQLVLPEFDDSIIELREEFKIILLDRGNRVLGKLDLSLGGSAGTAVDIKFIIVAACKANASAIVLCHNHPSGNLKPSRSDIEVTNKIKKAMELIDITLQDHLIISPFGYFSFCDERLL